MISVGQTKVKISPLMIICGLIWLLSGNITTFLTLAFTVIIHEFFHTLCARGFFLVCESVTLYPFGGDAHIIGIDENPFHSAVVALAGPLLSLFFGFLYSLGTEYGIFPVWNEFVSFSYSVAFINMIPVYPLDGGRILCGILCARFGKKGFRAGKISGLIIACVYVAFNVYLIAVKKNYSGSVMAAFIFYASLASLKEHTQARKTPESGEIRWITARKNESLFEIGKRFAGIKYNAVLVLDENGGFNKILSEDELKEMLIKNSIGTV